MPDSPAFAVDRSLGRLARWLRRLGYDAEIRLDLDRHGIETLAVREGRVLLTREVPRRRTPARAKMLCLTADRFRDQLREIDAVHPLGGWTNRRPRCLACNAETEPSVSVAEASPWCRRCRAPADRGGHAARIEAQLHALSLRAPDAL